MQQESGTYPQVYYRRPVNSSLSLEFDMLSAILLIIITIFSTSDGFFPEYQ